MKLLTFAHRGEAQAFLNQEKSGQQFSPVEFIFSGLLKSSNYYLLITGEGAQSATEKTIATLTQFSHEIEEVINLGVAGSLNPKLKKDDLIWVRTVYAHHAEKLEFKSFSSENKSSHHDCLSAFTRILNFEEKKKMSLFADLIDRELWAIASAAHLFKLPFKALKIISDEFKTEHEEICRFIKEEAAHFSEKLLHEFLLSQGDSRPTSSDQGPSQFLTDKSFYFTISQERKLNSCLESLKLKGTLENELLSDPFIISLKVQDTLPKERTRLLLKFLSEKLNPISKIIHDQIEETLSPLKKAKIQTSYDNDFEEDWLNINARIQSRRDLERLINALKIFSYEDYKKILDGHLDV